MYFDTLAPNAKGLFDKLSLIGLPTNFYLSGGTALALHLGHRESEDLDFFSKEEFDPQKVQAQLDRTLSLSNIVLDSGTLNCYADGVKLQFLHYPYDLLETPQAFNNINLSSVPDIACTKLLTISSRGSKKDFIDLYFILASYSLNELFELLKKKYPSQSYNELHILKSMAYFDDADDQPAPKMHKEISWSEVKKFITNSVKDFQI
jgi:predicted nucleotidyltransferase component of viral defense system